MDGVCVQLTDVQQLAILPALVVVIVNDSTLPILLLFLLAAHPRVPSSLPKTVIVVHHRHRLSLLILVVLSLKWGRAKDTEKKT
jgi:hypothetical protein